MKLPRFAVIILPLLVWLLSETYLIWPELMYFSLITSAVLVIGVSFILKTPERRTPWWATAILPLVFIASSAVYVSLQTSRFLIQLVFFALLIFIFSYFKDLYYFWQRPDLYDEEAHTRIRAYGGFLTIFFAGADLYGLQSLLSLTVWPLLIAFAVIALAVCHDNLGLNNQSRRTIWQFMALDAFLLLETAIVFVFWPLNYNVTGLALGIVYYMLINLTRLYLQQALTSKKIKLYLIISYAGLAVLLLTARWLN
jgi:hypothetical protein